MARLTKQEKMQLLDAAARKEPRAPQLPAASPAQFVAFATFASGFKSTPKPVRFGGSHWKL